MLYQKDILSPSDIVLDQMDYLPMIVMMIIAGLLSTMNLWVVQLDHIHFHINDMYMILLMTSWMVLFMSLYHRDFATSGVAIIFVMTFIYLIRTQTGVNTQQFMMGMISHHSMAVLMAQKLQQRSDKIPTELKHMLDSIISSQQVEIRQMQLLLKSEDAPKTST